MSGKGVIQPELLWVDGRFERHRRLEIGPDGRIAAVGAARPAEASWSRRAVLPGFVNAHSHAFQRGLRGRGETFGDGAGSFWTWREAMYGLVDAMDASRLATLSRQAFTEMLAAGITTVGEFHYLHHDATGEGYAFDEVVRQTAADAGIRLVLLAAYYRTGGIGAELAGGQRRFATRSLDEYWRHLDDIARRLDPATQTLGAVAHSIRAVPAGDLVDLHAESVRRGLVFHMHVEEQPAEIEACLAAHGRRPMALLNERLAIDDRFCAVHCTHTDPQDMATFLGHGGRVCLCPLTEANLGDGIADVPGIRAAGGAICLGTDSNARIDFNEEARWLEYVQRLATETRGVCVDGSGSCAAALLECATVHGADALGIDAGEIRVGAWADLIAIDLGAPALAGADGDHLLTAFLLGGGGDQVAATCVGGRWVAGRGP